MLLLLNHLLYAIEPKWDMNHLQYAIEPYAIESQNYLLLLLLNHLLYAIELKWDMNYPDNVRPSPLTMCFDMFPFW